jgi:hypothetical protein
VTACVYKRLAVKSDLKPGMIVHTTDCSVSLMALAVTPFPAEGEPVMDWSTGEPLDRYPAMAYIHDAQGVVAKSGYYPLLASNYHLAEIQRLEEPA